MWSRFGELARERGADVSSVLAFSETLWLWADAVMDVVASAHREVELELAREEQQRRDAFVLALLTGHDRRRRAAARVRRPSGSTPSASTSRSARARRRRPQLPRRVALALAGDDGLVTALDHDLVGLAARAPVADAGRRHRPRPAGAARPTLPNAFALASRALQTALAFGEEGTFSLADLSIRPAILADEALGDAFAARYLEPLAALGRLGAELETTLRTWFDEGMRVEDAARALHVHPNTLRHRLRRFEEATGAEPAPTRADLVELWWALERRRLAAGLHLSCRHGGRPPRVRSSSSTATAASTTPPRRTGWRAFATSSPRAPRCWPS